MKPTISIIICTYNGQDLIQNCLNSILEQSVKEFEIICVDGLSKDSTQKIIREYAKKDKRIKVILNKNRLPEGKGNGKWLGYKEAKGEIIGFIDQDNILQRRDLFDKVIKEFSKNKNTLGILGGLTHNKKDRRIVRYVSLTGTDSFFAYRSLDLLRNVRKLEKEDDIEYIPLYSDNMCLTGGNCFFYRKSDLDSIGGYSQDVLSLKKLADKKKGRISIIVNSTKHYAEKNILALVKKKFFWGRKYFSKKSEEFNYLPKSKLEIKKFIQNILFNFLVVPNFYYSLKLYKKSADVISLLFPIIAFLNTLAYGFTFAKRKITSFFDK